jgi:predicted Rossmann fold flavoprotein
LPQINKDWKDFKICVNPFNLWQKKNPQNQKFVLIRAIRGKKNNMIKNFDIIIVGGGAAGFFTAINIAEKNPKLKIAILERGKEVLSKVRVSGGGRCNVTHACFEPNELVKFYPRGEKELRGPFHQFCSGDTIEWFEKHGVELKIEDDGRMFPVSNSSQTIIDCFLKATEKLGIKVLIGQSVQSIFKSEKHWKIDTQNENYAAEKLILATGSNPKIWEMLQTQGHAIVSPVPSLFTFNIKDSRIKELPGVAAQVTVTVKDTKLESTGPLLITHWGMSGPAILKLSAWGARTLFDKNYQFTIFVNWLNDVDTEDAEKILKDLKQEHAKKAVSKKSPFDFPNRLWESFVLASAIDAETKWADLSKIQLQNLASQLTKAKFQVNGKSTFKEEFVTAGGIDLKEINFKTMESKLHQNLYFAGEIVNIDAITGGFNFQNAWTSGFILANSI